MDKRQLKSLEKRKKNLKAKITEIFNRKNEDLCFENLGIDHLIVDESHYQNFYEFPIKLLNYLVIIYFAP